jgi:hypothetical protein
MGCSCGDKCLNKEKYTSNMCYDGGKALACDLGIVGSGGMMPLNELILAILNKLCLINDGGGALDTDIIEVPLDETNIEVLGEVTFPQPSVISGGLLKYKLLANNRVWFQITFSAAVETAGVTVPSLFYVLVKGLPFNLELIPSPFPFKLDKTVTLSDTFLIHGGMCEVFESIATPGDIGILLRSLDHDMALNVTESTADFTLSSTLNLVP